MRTSISAAAHNNIERNSLTDCQTTVANSAQTIHLFSQGSGNMEQTASLLNDSNVLYKGGLDESDSESSASSYPIQPRTPSDLGFDEISEHRRCDVVSLC